MGRLILDSSSTAQWHRLVTDAQVTASRQLGEDSESYLVFLLMRYLRDRELLRQVMALGYLRAMQTTGRLQSERLRDVGDQCLILAGLFPGQARRRRVRSDYFVAMGRSAYDQLRHGDPPGLGDLYGLLADEFLALRDVLAALRPAADDAGEALATALRGMDRHAAAAPGQALTADGKIPGDATHRRH